MSYTRRTVLATAIGLMTGVGGCLGSSNTEPVEELQLNLANTTDTTYTFHFVIESDDCIGKWRQFKLDQGSNRVVSFEPEFNEPPLGYHALFGDEQVSGSIFPQEDGMGTCYELIFRITPLEEENISATQSTNPCAEQ